MVLRECKLSNQKRHGTNNYLHQPGKRLMHKGKGKGKVHPRTGHEGPEGKKRYSSILSLISALDGEGWSTPRPGRFTPGKESRYPLYRRLGGPQDQSGRFRKISPSTGIRSPDRPTRSESLYRLSYPGPYASNAYELNSLTLSFPLNTDSNATKLS